MIEIKLSQGAKFGKGGILPGAKVTPEIAEIRGIPVGHDSISPNRHKDINSSRAVSTWIARAREITGKTRRHQDGDRPSGWFRSAGDREINRRGIESAPDFITVDGAEGGTGAAPQPLIDMVGLSLREAPPVVVDKLIEYGLRESGYG